MDTPICMVMLWSQLLSQKTTPADWVSQASTTCLWFPPPLLAVRVLQVALLATVGLSASIAGSTGLRQAARDTECISGGWGDKEDEHLGRGPWVTHL